MTRKRKEAIEIARKLRPKAKTLEDKKAGQIA